MIKKQLLKLIKYYQKYVSSWSLLNPILPISPSCRFVPTCSEYTYQAIEKYGILRGIVKGFLRILKCNPFFKGGYDPI